MNRAVLAVTVVLTATKARRTTSECQIFDSVSIGPGQDEAAPLIDIPVS
jgi:hypothetical protein